MRKNILSLSIAAMIGGMGFAGVASASVLTTGAAADTLTVNNGGIGHILVVPYYTAQNGNATLINLVNTDTANGKEVKIRFRGASNSDDVLDFTLYMSPGDVWAAKVYKGDDGRAALITGDKTCTMPYNVNIPFKTGRLPAAFTAAQKAVETLEGYVEILNTANIPKGLQSGQGNVGGTVNVNPLFTNIKHVSGVAPCSTAASAALAANNAALASATLSALASTDFKAAKSAAGVGVAAAASEGAASSAGLSNPTGGLFANTTIINVATTLTFTQEATAISATLAGVPTAAAIVHSPQQEISIAGVGNSYGGLDNDSNADGVPGNAGDILQIAANAVTNTPAIVGPAAAVNVNALTADALLRTANVVRANATADLASSIVDATYQDIPDLSTPYILGVNTPLAQARNLTAQLAVKSVINEYLTTPGLSAFTDWTFSMPTRRYSVAMDYAWAAAKGGSDGRVFADLSAGAAPAVGVMAAGSAAAAMQTVSPARYFAPGNTVVSGTQICTYGDVLNGASSYDREEGTTGALISASPGDGGRLQWCGETSVISINATNAVPSSVLGATLAAGTLGAFGTEGWATIGTNGLNGNGLPVLGAMYSKATNTAVSAGVSGSYGLVANHRYTR